MLYGFKVQLPLDEAKSLEGKPSLHAFVDTTALQYTPLEILDILENYVTDHPEIHNDPDTWVEGMGWDQTRWKDGSGEFPTAVSITSAPLDRSLIFFPRLT